MAKAIMIQGTMSNAGKSLVAAGLCRIFWQDGYRVAPFKSQNMALNSFITREGLEMGRAQAMQAEACGVEPHVMMNPILLKPTSDMKSQVIVNGEVYGNQKAMDYFNHKQELIPQIQKAYGELDKIYDIIVIEGAGSPVEINLKKNDIVNMGMAKMAKAPVLLVGDIDRGGVFAQLVGTMLLLEPEEQTYVKGLLINKFRGDRKILEPGLSMLEEKCKKEVLGVIPYMQIDLEDEDSLSERLEKKHITGKVDIAVVRFPHISNFTDFNVLENIPEFSVRYITKPEEIGTPDMLVLPGSKNTIRDLEWLREKGLETLLREKAEGGTLLWGICGGYQMLGVTIEDPYGVETEGEIQGKINGMGLLPVHTVFTEEKVKTRVSGCLENLTGVYESLSGTKIEGYEIHMGATRMTEGAEVFAKIGLNGSAIKVDGAVLQNICGTYLHGVFDSEAMQEALKNLLFKRKNLTMQLTGEENSSRKCSSYKEYRESQYDKLAEEMRKNLDMDVIYHILEEGV